MLIVDRDNELTIYFVYQLSIHGEFTQYPFFVRFRLFFYVFASS